MVEMNLWQICFYLTEAGESCTPTSTRGSGLMHEGSAAKTVLNMHDSVFVCVFLTENLKTGRYKNDNKKNTKTIKVV